MKHEQNDGTEDLNLIRLLRDQMVKERLSLKSNPMTGYCLETQKRDALNAKISKLTELLAVPSL